MLVKVQIFGATFFQYLVRLKTPMYRANNPSLWCVFKHQNVESFAQYFIASKFAPFFVQNSPKFLRVYTKNKYLKV